MLIEEFIKLSVRPKWDIPLDILLPLPVDDCPISHISAQVLFMYYTEGLNLRSEKLQVEMHEILDKIQSTIGTVFVMNYNKIRVMYDIPTGRYKLYTKDELAISNVPEHLNNK